MRNQKKSGNSFDVELAGRTFQASIHRGAHSHSDTLFLSDDSGHYVLRRANQDKDGRYAVMRQDDDQFLWHQNNPVYVYWLGDMIVEAAPVS